MAKNVTRTPLKTGVNSGASDQIFLQTIVVYVALYPIESYVYLVILTTSYCGLINYSRQKGELYQFFLCFHDIMIRF